MRLHTKVPLISVRVLIRTLVYIFGFSSLFAAYRFYQEGHLSYQENARNKSYSLSNRRTLDKNRHGFMRIEKVDYKTPSTSSSSTSEYIDIKSYPYIMNEPNKCKDQSPFLIFLIATIASEIHNRKAIRKTFGNEHFINGTSTMCLFLLGTSSQQDPNALLDESETYHDIIQKDFLDTYKNLTLKTLMGIEWVSNYCPTAKYVMKTDSDMFVNTERLLDLLGPDQPQKQNYFTGYLMLNNRPHRDQNSKWHVPHSLYPEEFYPSFCSGTGYVFSGDVAPKILRSSLNIKYIYLEDVFVGLCLDKEGIKITQAPQKTMFNNFRVPFSPCVYNNIITSHYITPIDLNNYWIIVQENKARC
ncbi:beta-1,3-galactosyltransferase 2-like [Anomaloglossus baeobatrachus]|uniref:beta-1,3-galactosyltransferase 2-like n=1 Tax=Anomaloglossus baeobatrachus TaxID=238106 RepID=UPI003F501CBD